MNQFEQTIQNELSRIDPELSGLFELGVQLENELEKPGWT